MVSRVPSQPPLTPSPQLFATLYCFIGPRVFPDARTHFPPWRKENFNTGRAQLVVCQKTEANHSNLFYKNKTEQPPPPSRHQPLPYPSDILCTSHYHFILPERGGPEFEQPHVDMHASYLSLKPKRRQRWTTHVGVLLCGLAVRRC